MVFAPTDEAFAKLPEGTLESLLKPENRDQLRAILTYHVVPGEVMASQVKPGKVKTVNGEQITVAKKEGQLMVDEATIVQTDIAASNGVVHVIDSVILPGA
ncbi:MAG: fasciclin domain-containing protein [Spirochaetota bacterium]